eukprot:CAMPEP_0170179708 /NCGR_PEP_ID=MMETSP0040_2-20121228/18780_1 /TAXON_ID=641309 /ORGANISM="Lotharella oceanica, Strain CCMP622" /LENGTH=85 /DNA_ID=CAMNT_0010423961 /DNA_START=336 /DNA_END=593 /DNA_ORIENTATION=-
MLIQQVLGEPPVHFAAREVEEEEDRHQPLQELVSEVHEAVGPQGFGECAAEQIEVAEDEGEHEPDGEDGPEPVVHAHPPCSLSLH